MRPLVFWTLAAATLAAQPLSQGERDRAMSHMHATRKQFLDAIEGLSVAQWTFKPAPDRWSVAEVAEHIAISEETISQLAVQKAMQSPLLTAEQKEEQKKKDDSVIKMIPDRSQRFQAPEFLRPTNRWPNREALTAAFKATRGKNIAYIEKTTDELRSHAVPHPVMGPTDAYQWFLLMSAHAERHVAQIQEVKADPKFPK